MTDELRGPHVGGTHHLALLIHPRVSERLAQWLAAEHAHEPLRARR